MNNDQSNAANRQRIFVSYARDKTDNRKAAFERSVLHLLSQHAEDYVAEMQAERVMTALQARAASDTGRVADSNDVVEAVDPDSTPDVASAADDGLSRSHPRPRSARCAPVSTCEEILHGTHNADALAAGREFVEIAARRPSRGIWQSLSGKGGSGKTTLLLHLACIARRRSDMNVAVIDLGASDTTKGSTESNLAAVAGADLILIDNADCAPQSSRRKEWWAEFGRQVSKSACVLIAVTPDALGIANEPRRGCFDSWRHTTIGAFDYEFRRLLIDDMSGRHLAAHGGKRITNAAVNRLAEELWGDGWQIAEAVDACTRYGNVMARMPRPEEIDEIAANVGTTRRRDTPSPEAIGSATMRICDLTSCALPASKQARTNFQNDMNLYLTKVLTGQSIEAMGRQLDLGRRAAVQSILRIERVLQNNGEVQRVIDETLLELTADGPRS